MFPHRPSTDAAALEGGGAPWDNRVAPVHTARRGPPSMPEAPDPPPGAGPPLRRARHAAPRRRGRTAAVVIAVVVVVAAAVGGGFYLARQPATRRPAAATTGSRRATTDARSTAAAPTTTTTTTPETHGPLTTPPLPAPGPGFNAGQVTAVGDSVMLDYQTPLQQDIPGVNVDAGVSRQWSEGETILQQLKSSGQLGAVVIVGLSTNGPISSTDFDSMMSILSGASRVVFVTVHVDQPWQDPNNGVLAAGVSRYPNTVLADWNTLATQNPGWVYSDGTHLPIDGTGAQALAALVATRA